MTEMNTIWKEKKISINLKLKLLKCLVWVVMINGSEEWTLRKQDENRLESAEMWMYKSLLSMKLQDRRTKDSILKELNLQQQLLCEIRKRKIKYFGHICIKKSHSWKNAPKAPLEGTRKQGRPITSYIDNIKVCTNLNKSEDVYRTTERRREWKDTVRNATRAANAQSQMGYPNWAWRCRLKSRRWE